MADSRYERGLKNFAKIVGGDGEKALAEINAVSPDFARYIIEFPFGDIYERPQLDLRSREMCAVAALIVLGGAERQLYTHIQAALTVGVKKSELIEIVIQMANFAGYPRAINGIKVLASATDDFEKGQK
ncbi:carboxymuconolactone decarboxylase family protein [uncultured Tateyamaria sp.]|uniref:carboxymuconolactone decarboxylase family protein n=1 Tax=uncultured Tateyamaria sp. TaxID=455651 RepID=UPI002610CF54|nr:carboxymuconolactone decarboxylase family protein [uncultured Tateyamaria sp.]